MLGPIVTHRETRCLRTNVFDLIYRYYVNFCTPLLAHSSLSSYLRGKSVANRIIHSYIKANVLYNYCIEDPYKIAL